MARIPWTQPDVGDEELAEVAAAFADDWLTMGPRVRAFERVMSERLEVPHAIAVANGTIAIDIALLVAGIQPGDEVIVPSMTYLATAAAVSRVGAVPVFVDIEGDTYNLDPQLISAAVSEKTRAAIFIDFGGVPAQVDELRRETDKSHILLIQDAAQSLGATYKGKPMGAQTEISTMSYHMAKVLACVEGGMIFTHNDRLAEECRIYRNQGESGKYLHSHLGFNARMTDMTAAIGLAQERKLDEHLRQRARVAKMYEECFADAPGIRLPAEPLPDTEKSNFLFGVQVTKRTEVEAALRAEQIDYRICYPLPVYQQQVYQSGRYPYRAMPSPAAEELARTIIHLPMYPGLQADEIERIANIVRHAA